MRARRPARIAPKLSKVRPHHHPPCLATRVRGRVELVLDFASGRGLRKGPNPARWRGNLDAALPKPSKVTKVQHHATVKVGDDSDFMARRATIAGMGARALEFAILTAARSGEVRGARWTEIDLAAGLWTEPAERMKAGREHRVPLCDMSLSAVLRRMNIEATVHGFRGKFRDWASEHTNHPGEVAEMALAHAVGDKVEAVYRGGDLLDKRSALMTDWSVFLAASKWCPQALLPNRHRW
jgi:integrase